MHRLVDAMRQYSALAQVAKSDPIKAARMVRGLVREGKLEPKYLSGCVGYFPVARARVLCNSSIYSTLNVVACSNALRYRVVVKLDSAGVAACFRFVLVSQDITFHMRQNIELRRRTLLQQHSAAVGRMHNKLPTNK